MTKKLRKDEVSTEDIEATLNSAPPRLWSRKKLAAQLAAWEKVIAGRRKPPPVRLHAEILNNPERFFRLWAELEDSKTDNYLVDLDTCEIIRTTARGIAVYNSMSEAGVGFGEISIDANKFLATRLSGRSLKTKNGTIS